MANRRSCGSAVLPLSATLAADIASDELPLLMLAALCRARARTGGLGRSWLCLRAATALHSQLAGSVSAGVMVAPVAVAQFEKNMQAEIFAMIMREGIVARTRSCPMHVWAPRDPRAPA